MVIKVLITFRHFKKSASEKMGAKKKEFLYLAKNFLFSLIGIVIKPLIRMMIQSLIRMMI